MRRRRFGAPPPVRVHVCWKRWWRGRPRDFWFRVGALVRQRGVKWSDKGQVVGVCREVERTRKWD